MLNTNHKKKHTISKIGVVLGYLGLVMGVIGGMWVCRVFV